MTFRQMYMPPGFALLTFLTFLVGGQGRGGSFKLSFEQQKKLINWV